jgi:hypothetical protein
MMRPKKRLNLLFTYSTITCAISLVSLVRLTAIFAMRLTDTNIAMVFQMALFSLVYGGLLAPGHLVSLGVQHFFPLLFNMNLYFFMAIIISIIPWIILGFSIRKKQKNWIVFVGLFILTYTSCGALAFLLMMMHET